MATLRNWIRLQNLEPFVEVLAWLSGYKLADGEWDAIRYGLEDSDCDAVPPRWYSYKFAGEHAVSFDIGHDKGTDVVQVRLDIPGVIASRADVALNLMNQYVLGRGS